MNRNAACVLICSAMALLACTNATQPGTVKLSAVVPDKHTREQVSGMFGGPSAFTPFTGQYPFGWPQKFTLPAGCLVDSRGFQKSSNPILGGRYEYWISFIFKGQAEDAKRAIFSQDISDTTQLYEITTPTVSGGEMRSVQLPGSGDASLEAQLNTLTGPEFSDGWCIGLLAVFIP